MTEPNPDGLDEARAQYWACLAAEQAFDVEKSKLNVLLTAAKVRLGLAPGDPVPLWPTPVAPPPAE